MRKSNQCRHTCGISVRMCEEWISKFSNWNQNSWTCWATAHTCSINQYSCLRMLKFILTDNFSDKFFYDKCFDDTFLFADVRIYTVGKYFCSVSSALSIFSEWLCLLFHIFSSCHSALFWNLDFVDNVNSPSTLASTKLSNCWCWTSFKKVFINC